MRAFFSGQFYLGWSQWSLLDLREERDSALVCLEDIPIRDLRFSVLDADRIQLMVLCGVV